MAVQIQVRNDSSTNWSSANPTLAVGEFGYETDTGKLKVGDGSTAWNSLAYNGVSSTYVDTEIANTISYIDTEIATVAPLNQTLSTKTANYTIQSTDNGSVIKANGTLTITLPSSTIPAGGRVDIINIGTGTVTIAGSGVTISSKDSANTIATQFAAATIISNTTTTAYLIGDIA